MLPAKGWELFLDVCSVCKTIGCNIHLFQNMIRTIEVDRRIHVSLCGLKEIRGHKIAVIAIPPLLLSMEWKRNAGNVATSTAWTRDPIALREHNSCNHDSDHTENKATEANKRIPNL